MESTTQPSAHWGIPTKTGNRGIETRVVVDGNAFAVMFHVTDHSCEVTIPAIPEYRIVGPNPGDPYALLAEIVEMIKCHLDEPVN